MSFRSIATHFTFILIVLAIEGCAPSLGSGLSVNEIPVESIESLDKLSELGIKVNVLPFRDEREDRYIAQVVSGRKVGALGDPGGAVMGAFQRYLSASGVRLSPFDAYTIDGIIKKWNMELDVGFPISRADVDAEIELTIFDPSKKAVLTGTYKGSATLEHPFIESHLEELLGKAMSYAIKEAIVDPKFVSVVSSNDQSRLVQ